jgi:glycosyltransferase involved in cell wall biosynthesis
LVGYILHRITGLPWIIEFRDPWILNPFREPRPFRWMESFENWLERKMLHSADHVVVTSIQYMRDFLRRYPTLKPDAFSYVPNGYDPEDFENVMPRSFEKFTILHTGNFYEARSPIPFLKALRVLLHGEPQLRANFQVLFVGKKDLNAEAALKEFSLEDVVRQVGSVSHASSIEYMLGADVLLLIPGPGNGTMPGKTFEYLAARKPILAIAEPGVAQELISSAGIGMVAAPDDIAGIANALRNMYRGITEKSYRYPDTSDLRNRYDRRQLAGRIAQILANVTATKIGQA